MTPMRTDIKKAMEHMLETNLIRKTFWHMDEKVGGLKYGIRQGDDSVIVGDFAINMEGPYPLKIGRRTGLIHTCSDIVVMGGRPLFALNSMQVDSVKEGNEVAKDIKKQSNGLGVPVIGGNTQMESNLTPCVSFAVFGKILKKPIADSGARIGDKILMLGAVVEGSIGERVYRAKTKFNAFLEMVERGMEIHGSKDCSRGGWFGNLTELLVKSQRGIEITSIPYPRITRYMGTYLLAVPRKETSKFVEMAAKHKCPLIEVGTVTRDISMKIGKRVVVTEKKMQEFIRKFPYKKPKD